MIYFAQSGGATGPIKIGKADNVANRLAAINVGQPVPLELLGVMPGDLREETMLHGLFRWARIRNEWFEPVEELLALVKQLLPPSPSMIPRPEKVAPVGSVGHEMRAWRLRLNLLLMDAAAELGLPPRSIEDWERGIRRPDYPEFVRKLMKWYKPPKQR